MLHGSILTCKWQSLPNLQHQVWFAGRALYVRFDWYNAFHFQAIGHQPSLLRGPDFSQKHGMLFTKFAWYNLGNQNQCKLRSQSIYTLLTTPYVSNYLVKFVKTWWWCQIWLNELIPTIGLQTFGALYAHNDAGEQQTQHANCRSGSARAHNHERAAARWSALRHTSPDEIWIRVQMHLRTIWIHVALKRVRKCWWTRDRLYVKFSWSVLRKHQRTIYICT